MNPQGTYPLPNQSSNKKIGLIVLVVLFVAALVFGVISFISMQNSRKTNSQNLASATAANATAASLQLKYDTLAKQPYKSYKGPTTFGSLSFSYPKNWSAYVDETGTDEPINGFFYPDQVPGIQGKTAFALRLELVNTAYADVLSTFTSSIKSGSVKAAAYVPPKLNGVANIQPGTKLDGVIDLGNQFSGSMVVMKVRDKTLKIYTESNDFKTDFNNIILSSLTFAP